MGAAFGGGATQQVFGGRGAGNLLTRATATCATIFMVTSISLAWMSSSGDRDLKARVILEQRKGKGNEGTKVKATKPKPSAAPNEGAPPADSSPAEHAPTP
jgi:preprotein translocase subunit SecG